LEQNEKIMDIAPNRTKRSCILPVGEVRGHSYVVYIYILYT